MRYLQCVQVGKNANDILKLPCVVAAFKVLDKFVYQLSNGFLAYEGDWIRQNEDGNWTVVSDEEHQSLCHSDIQDRVLTKSI